MTNYEARRERLRRLMHAQHLDALLVFSAANRFYLSGFELHDPQYNESAGCLLVCANGEDWLCTDARYLDAAKRLWTPDRIHIYNNERIKMIGELSNHYCSGNIGFEAQILSLSSFETLNSATPRLQLQRADGLVEQLRRIKDADEIARMRASCQLNHQLMEWLPSQLAPGQSEADVAWMIERFFREHGASEQAFAGIAARGVNAALPHCIPSKEALLRDGDILLIDVGCRMDEYCSDQTRTFWVGKKPEERFLRTLDMVRAAQQAGLQALRPGVACRDVYAAAYAVFEQYGVASAFTHGLGHGIGLETHESPSLNPRNSVFLEPGMVVTVEPGLYYPDWGGVRWEYMVLVTEDGMEVL